MFPTSESATTCGGDLQALIRDIPDYPKPGIVFKDITPLLASPDAFAAATEAMAAPFSDAGITHVVAIESRGFILGGPIAQRTRARGSFRCESRGNCQRSRGERFV